MSQKKKIIAFHINSSNQITEWRRSALIVSALASGSSGPGSSPRRGHCVVFLGKTLYTHYVYCVSEVLLH